MAFERSRRYGRFWDDVTLLDKLLNNYPFHSTGKDENDFEHGVASYLMARNADFNCEVITQIHKGGTVKPVYCFGKNHRPDIIFDPNGIALELKFITYGGLKNAIGQGFVYRLQYKFVCLVLIISESKKNMYEDIALGKESELDDTLQHLADEMNIFTYVVPAFPIKKVGMKKCLSYFKPRNK